MKELETSPEIMVAIIGSSKHVRGNTTLSTYSVGNCAFGGSIMISSITFMWVMECQVERGTKRNYLWMNKKKSACLWTIAILKKLLLIRWDM